MLAFIPKAGYRLPTSYHGAKSADELAGPDTHRPPTCRGGGRSELQGGCQESGEGRRLSRTHCPSPASHFCHAKRALYAGADGLRSVEGPQTVSQASQLKNLIKTPKPRVSCRNDENSEKKSFEKKDF